MFNPDSPNVGMTSMPNIQSTATPDITLPATSDRHFSKFVKRPKMPPLSFYTRRLEQCQVFPTDVTMATKIRILKSGQDSQKALPCMGTHV